MFNFSHTFVVGSSLFWFILPVTLGQRGILIAWRERVENPYVKKCALSIVTPEAVCCNIKLGTVLPVCCTMDQVFVGDWLQMRLSTNIVANFTQ